MVLEGWTYGYTCQGCGKEYLSKNEAAECERDHQNDCIHEDIFFMGTNRLRACCKRCHKVGEVTADNSTFRTSYTMRVNFKDHETKKD